MSLEVAVTFCSKIIGVSVINPSLVQKDNVLATILFYFLILFKDLGILGNILHELTKNTTSIGDQNQQLAMHFNSLS